MKLLNTWFFAAMALSLASAASSVIAAGSARPDFSLIEPGTIASVIASSEGWPITCSISACSAASGPMWRPMNSSWCSSWVRFGMGSLKRVQFEEEFLGTAGRPNWLSQPTRRKLKLGGASGVDASR